MTEMYFEIYPSSKGDYRWRVKASNGRTMPIQVKAIETAATANTALVLLKTMLRILQYES
jgi:uncharacterized protein YegP (UPF0339 family)